MIDKVGYWYAFLGFRCCRHDSRAMARRERVPCDLEDERYQDGKSGHDAKLHSRPSEIVHRSATHQHGRMRHDRYERARVSTERVTQQQRRDSDASSLLPESSPAQT